MVVESATAFAIESDGGGRATVFVRTAATAIFDADDKKEVLTILISDNQSPLARRAALTITLRSSPRAVNAASVLEATLDATDASSATEARLFGREDVRASLWHYEGEAEYALDAGVYHDRIALESDGVYFRDDLIVRSATMFFTVILRALSSDAALTARQAVVLIVNGNDPGMGASGSIRLRRGEVHERRRERGIALSYLQYRAVAGDCRERDCAGGLAAVARSRTPKFRRAGERFVWGKRVARAIQIGEQYRREGDARMERRARV